MFKPYFMPLFLGLVCSACNQDYLALNSAEQLVKFSNNNKTELGNDSTNVKNDSIKTTNDSVKTSNDSITYHYSTEIYKSMAGVDTGLLSLDIHYNSQVDSLKPIVIWVHGGGWTSGDKGFHMRDKVLFMRSIRAVLVSVNYRLSPYPFQLDNASRIKYPIHHTDILDAILWVSKNIEAYGGDPRKIILMGHSAGGHLVSLIGSWPELLKNKGFNISNLKGVISLDTEGYDVSPRTKEGNIMYINAFGNDPDLNKEASPINHLATHSASPKFLIIKRGDYLRVQLSNHFISRLKSTGHDVSEWSADMFTHNEVDEVIGSERGQELTEQIKIFIQKCVQ